jgi:hypothetical protein
MTHRDQNLWGLIVGLALTVSFGVYKASHGVLPAPAESSSPGAPNSAPDHPDEPYGTDAGLYSSDDIDAAADKAMNDAANAAAAASQAANSLSGQSQGQDSPPPQNLLPEGSSDGTIANINPSTSSTPTGHQPDGGEE